MHICHECAADVLGVSCNLYSYPMYFFKRYHALILLPKARRLQNVTVAVGSTFDPNDLVSFNPETFTPCVYEPGQFLQGETREMNCSRPVTGRYVTVYIYQTETTYPLTICELQVFGGPLSGKSSQVTF